MKRVENNEAKDGWEEKAATQKQSCYSGHQDSKTSCELRETLKALEVTDIRDQGERQITKSA